MHKFDSTDKYQFSRNNSAQNPSAPRFVPILQGPQTRYGNNRWMVYSPKLNRVVTLYSDLEYDHWVLVEADPEIVTFCEQPLKITVNLPLKRVSSIFDMWVYFKSGLEQFREVKFHRELNNPDPKSRTNNQIEAQKKWCKSKGADHVVMTEREIRQAPYCLQNYKIILRYFSKPLEKFEGELLPKINSIMKLGEQYSLKELEKYFQSDEGNKVRLSVFQLMLKGEIRAVDLHLKLIDRETKFERYV